MSDDLYFVRGPDGPVKIGKAGNVANRLSTMQCGSPVPLKLVGSIKGLGWQEYLWHLAFHNQRLHGEWFRYDGDLPEAIALAKAGGDWTKPLGSFGRSVRLVIIQVEKMIDYARSHTQEIEGQGWDTEPLSASEQAYRQLFAPGYTAREKA